MSAPINNGDPAAVGRLITGHAWDAIFLLDAEGSTTFADPAAERMFGWSAAELSGRKLHDLVHYKHPDGQPLPMSECPLGSVFTSGRSLSIHEDTFFHWDGTAVAVACSNAAVVRDGIAATVPALVKRALGPFPVMSA